MRKATFAIFFSAVLTVHTAINSYIFLKGWDVLPQNAALRISYSIVFAILALSFIVGRLAERRKITKLSSALVWVGSFWLAAMAYFFLILVSLDVFRLTNAIVPWFPSFVTVNPLLTKQVVALLVVGVVTGAVVLGHLNAIRPRIRTLKLSIDKNHSAMKELNIVAVSDIHLGTIIGKQKLENIVQQINRLNPDLVLLPGDVFDEDIGPVIKENLGETLRTIHSKFGVYAVTGNHEYIGGEKAACQYLEDHGISVLRDRWIKINDSVFVVGREDISIRQFSGQQRKSLEELMVGVDKRYPVILLDHQPFRLDEAERNGVDLQLSGHTHHGQLWPFTYIAQKVFEVSWGYKRKGNTHIYVSCGVGTWGPPVRIGNHPEIMNIRLTMN
jgi:predicted MPP superfamily phosphohydrolase